MIGILIISHAPLGAALVACAKHVFSEPPEHFAVLDVVPDTEPPLLLAQACQLVQQINAGQGVLVLTDLFGGTPSNIATQLTTQLTGERVAVVTGVNLPMLLRAITYRHTDLQTVVEKAMSGATNGIVNLVSKAPQVQPSTQRKTNFGTGDNDDSGGDQHNQ
jgi:PTS system ascorbate-specific IIA component